MLNLLRRIWGRESRSRVKRNTFNIMFAEQPQFLSSLFDWSHWRLTGVIDLPHFFRALPSLVPKGSILCLAGRAWPNRVQNILDTISLNMESAPPPAANLTLGFDEAYIISVTPMVPNNHYSFLATTETIPKIADSTVS